MGKNTIMFQCQNCGYNEKNKTIDNFKTKISYENEKPHITIILQCTKCGHRNSFDDLKKITFNNVKCSACEKIIHEKELSGFNTNIGIVDGVLILNHNFLVSCPTCGHYVDAHCMNVTKNFCFFFNI